MATFFPTVNVDGANGSYASSIDSVLIGQRIIIIDGVVDERLSMLVLAQLLYLDSVNNEDIKVYFNSRGGSVYAGLAIQDGMDNCRSDIVIIGSGQLCSMGCYFLSMGTPGKRFITKRTFVMAHQASAGASGHIEDMERAVANVRILNNLLTTEIAKAVGVDVDTFMGDVSRDHWMDAETAMNYGTNGFCDGIISGARDADGELIIQRRGDSKPKVKAKSKPRT